MKQITSNLLMTLFLVCFRVGHCQNVQYKWQLPPQKYEEVVSKFNGVVDGGYNRYSDDFCLYTGEGENDRQMKNYTLDDLYSFALEQAKSRYANIYPNFELRYFGYEWKEEKRFRYSKRCDNGSRINYYEEIFRYYITATVVVPKDADPQDELRVIIEKSMRNIRQGSRIAIDQVKVINATEKDDYEDMIVETLLDNGFKVVAKEYLEKLYEEQQNQQSDIYNDRTKVQENNFSAIGYYLNFKLTNNILLVQVINVSTGEYEGNAVFDLKNKKTISEKEEKLSDAIGKALANLNNGSRIAIDQIRVPAGKDKEEYKDGCVEVLLDKGFKVVAKEYLEKLYEEHKKQQTGIYNDRTTVIENNFSAVGYFLNVRLTDESLRIQVVNVSTGEYEGNVTVKLK